MHANAYESDGEPLTSHVMESDLEDSANTNVPGTAVATSMTLFQSSDAASVARTFSNGWLTKYGAARGARTHNENGNTRKCYSKYTSYSKSTNGCAFVMYE